MLFWEVIAVYSENPKKHIKNTVTKMQRLMTVKAGDRLHIAATGL
jgi:hypothetical protein